LDVGLLAEQLSDLRFEIRVDLGGRSWGGPGRSIVGGVQSASGGVCDTAESLVVILRVDG
jgi:hypothetical protein